MSSDGELYITETCRDCFEKDLNKVFKDEPVRLSHQGVPDDMSCIGKQLIVDIYDVETDDIVGEATIKNKLNVVTDGMSGMNYVEPEPVSIKIKKFKINKNQIPRKGIVLLDQFLLDCEHFDNTQREAIVEYATKLKISDES